MSMRKGPPGPIDFEDRRAFGEAKEREAWQWLNSRHPAQRRLLARNAAWRGGELDLVFEEGDQAQGRGVTLVFCEVRCRRHARLEPVETVTWGKRMRLRRSAERFLARYSGRARGVRFDLLGWTPVRGWEWRRGFMGQED